MASVTTLLFNANPLMRYDGYYVLSDFLQVPNLYPRGQQRVGLWVRRYLLGVDARGENDSPRVRLVTSVYGLLSCGWRILVCVGLVISASALFAGAGVVIAAGAVVAWLLAPAVRFTTYLVRGTPTERPRLWRFAWSSTLLAALVVVPLGSVPWIVRGRRPPSSNMRRSPWSGPPAGASSARCRSPTGSTSLRAGSWSSSIIRSCSWNWQTSNWPSSSSI